MGCRLISLGAGSSASLCGNLVSMGKWFLFWIQLGVCASKFLLAPQASSISSLSPSRKCICLLLLMVVLTLPLNQDILRAGLALFLLCFSFHTQQFSSPSLSLSLILSPTRHSWSFWDGLCDGFPSCTWMACIASLCPAAR